MGRITIFSADGCPHSKRTKAAFNKYAIPFTEISVTKYPKKREDMLSLSNRLATPQVFFNTRLVGGADDTIELLENWNTDKSRNSSPLERYKVEILDQPDPFNERFAIPHYPPVTADPSPPRGDAEYSIMLPKDEQTTVLNITEILKNILPTSGRTFRLTEYKNSVTGSEAVEALMANFDICAEKAVAFGKRLQSARILDHVTGDHEFQNTDKYFYRLTCHQTPDVLNSYRVWTEQVDPNSMRLMSRLAESLNQVESAVTDAKGEVNYKSARTHPKFVVFEEAVCELQAIDLVSMDQNTLTAFGINLYNLMIKYAFMKVGISSSDFTRLAFFNSVKFNVGGYKFSFQEWENGVLRGNRKAPYSLSHPFGKNDLRLKFVIKEPDCRIHFSLNCGAKSCPPVNQFSAEHLDEELSIVAYAFCEENENVLIDPQKKELHLSSIFHWYRVDFSEGKKDLPQKLLEYLRGIKKQSLERLLDGRKSIKIVVMSYDWSTNANEFVPFSGELVKANVKSVKSILPTRKASKSMAVQ